MRLKARKRTKSICFDTKTGAFLRRTKRSTQDRAVSESIVIFNNIIVSIKEI